MKKKAVRDENRDQNPTRVDVITETPRNNRNKFNYDSEIKDY
jgi:hypothetical protein